MMSKKHRPAEGSITIEGLLIPVDWDEEGIATETAVSTYFEEEYFIEKNSRGQALLPFLREMVKVIGLVRIDDRGRKVLKVREYEIIEE